MAITRSGLQPSAEGPNDWVSRAGTASAASVASKERSWPFRA
jgi:hypothetical protein